MKLIALALALLLLPIPNHHSVNLRELSGMPQDTQVKNAELLKLEAQFKQIDEQSDPVKVKVTGDKESSGNVTISVEREIPTVIPGVDSANANTSKSTDTGKTVKKKETLLSIDLSKIDVPDEYINAKIAAAFSTPSESGACPGVKVMQIGAGVNYEVVEDYIYNSGAYSLTVFKGFTYDRASIPRIFWVIIDKDSLSNVPPLLHDLLYRHGGVLPTNQVSPYRKFSRKDTDDLFLELMTKCGVTPWRRELAYQAVRKFAGSAWKE